MSYWWHRERHPASNAPMLKEGVLLYTMDVRALEHRVDNADSCLLLMLCLATLVTPLSLLLLVWLGGVVFK